MAVPATLIAICIESFAAHGQETRSSFPNLGDIGPLLAAKASGDAAEASHKRTLSRLTY